MPLRRILFALLALSALAVAGYTTYWFHVQGEVRKGLDRWLADRRAAGWIAETGEVSVSGFPGRIRMSLPAPRLDKPGALAWRGPELTAEASPFDLTRVDLQAPGRHDFAWAGQQAWAEAGALTGLLDLDTAGRPEELRLALDRLSARLPKGEEISADHMSATVDPLPAADGSAPDAPSLAFTATLSGVILPPLPQLILDRKLASAELTGHLRGRLGSTRPADILRWSAEGGTLELDRIALDWAPLALEGDGTIALDGRGQPVAALSSRIRGFNELMDRLARAGVVEPGAATAGRLVLSLLAKPDAQGRPAVPIPVTLQDGSLWLGPARVGRVPPLVWPEQ